MLRPIDAAPSFTHCTFCAVISAVLLCTPFGPIMPLELSKLKLMMFASRPAMPRTRLLPPPIMMGTPPFCTGFGTASNSLRCTYLPLNSTCPGANIILAAFTYSSKRVTRSPAGSSVMPIASYSAANQPAPKPNSKRPSEKKSSVAASFMSTAAGR